MLNKVWLNDQWINSKYVKIHQNAEHGQTNKKLQKWLRCAACYTGSKI